MGAVRTVTNTVGASREGFDVQLRSTCRVDHEPPEFGLEIDICTSATIAPGRGPGSTYLVVHVPDHRTR